MNLVIMMDLVLTESYHNHKISLRLTGLIKHVGLNCLQLQLRLLCQPRFYKHGHRQAYLMKMENIPRVEGKQ